LYCIVSYYILTVSQGSTVLNMQNNTNIWLHQFIIIIIIIIIIMRRSFSFSRLFNITQNYNISVQMSHHDYVHSSC